MEKGSVMDLLPGLISALQLGDKNKAIISFFTLLRIIMQERESQTPDKLK